MTKPDSASPKPRRRPLLGGLAALILLACVCTSALPGGTPDPTPFGGGDGPRPTDEAASQATAEAALTLPPALPPTAIIPPTASVGSDYHEVKQGQIESPGQLITYTFDAVPGQEFYFGVVQVDSDIATTEWQVTDQDGLVVFSACIGCGDPGAYILARGGTYTMTIGEPDSGTGAFQVVIANVRVHYFPITLGDPISLGQPAPGAGSIEAPGARDMYTFNAEAGQEVYFGTRDADTVSLVSWRVVNSADLEVFTSCLGCGNPGVYTLSTGGLYTIIVGSGSGLQTGSYTLVMNAVRTDEFAISPGTPISDGLPGPGAGNIESPGARDVYTFSATPSQQVTFDVLQSGAVALTDFRLTDDTGAEIFATCLGCGNPGTFTLERGGVYTLSVGGGGDIETGTYQLDVH